MRNASDHNISCRKVGNEVQLRFRTAWCVESVIKQKIKEVEYLDEHDELTSLIIAKLTHTYTTIPVVMAETSISTAERGCEKLIFPVPQSIRLKALEKVEFCLYQSLFPPNLVQ
jgi:hypothetical protein